MPRKKQKSVAEAIAETYTNAYMFVLFAFPWGVKGTPLENQTGPDEWQKRQLLRISKKIKENPLCTIREAIASGHGIGKSTEVAWLILWLMSTRPHLNGVATANTKSQLETKTWRELAIWHKRLRWNADWFKWTATKFAHVDHPETWFVAAIPNTEHNSEAFAGLHGEHVVVFYDEASAIADRIWEVSEGAMTTDRAMWYVYGNPTQNKGRFRECFGAKAHRWSTDQIDSRDCKMTNKEELARWAEDYGEDSDFFRVRVRGVFPRASDAQFIPNDIVEAAQKRTLEPSAYRHYPKMLGVDVARFGTNRSVIIRRQGPKVWEPKSFIGMDLMEFAGLIAQDAMQFGTRTIFVDGTGVGGGVVDRLTQLDFDVIDVQFGRKAQDRRSYFNFRSELWGRMKEWLEGDVDIPRRPALEQDLTGPQYGLNTKLQVQLEHKTDMIRRGVASPDEADAIVVTFAEFAGTARAVQARRVKQLSAAGWT